MGREAQAAGLEENWERRAACLGVDPDLFFPDRGGSQNTAKEICSRCVVRIICLEVNINEKFGVWGGLSERERRRLRRARTKSETLRLVS